jgi:hypothetical protein
MAELIGKKELARRLNWARTRLDRRLRTDPLFPVEAHGDQAGGWVFDYERIAAYLEGAPPAERLASAPGGGRAPAVVIPRWRSAHHAGEASARHRRDTVDAELREDRLRSSRAELVDRREVARALRPVIDELTRHLEHMPALIAERLERNDLLPTIEALIAPIREELLTSAAPLLEPSTDPGSAE